ncbi:tetratricopeptide repeat protein 7A [Dorcoceras hygrometricum]|uniref:Tetratricopeptide repeat protein 7A n=1 Tax=Dorcoceras hygrometricum TaxID=472368 RepID=A0A2Z7D8F1_9LAMI|nr:tetratricopeptide repeat protein 7A [Dorcoceras hygrometricum]
MSLFDLQDVCIAIGSLATLDLTMVVDLIGIYGLKGPYCTLTTTNWFLQALSVIPMGSWRDVARRFTMIRWASPKLYFGATMVVGPRIALKSWPPPSSPKAAVAAVHHHRRRRRPPPSPPPPPLSDRTCSNQLFEKFPSVLISPGLLVQADEGTLLPVVDLIRRNLPPPTVKCRFPRETGQNQAPRRQQGNNQRTPYEWFVELYYCIECFPVLILNFRFTAGRRDPDPPRFSNSGIRAKARILQYNFCHNCI